MANLFEDTIERNAVHLRNINSAISFSSESDALSAAFVSRYPNLPWYIIDDLLAMCHNVSFLSNDVAFKCTEDILDSLAKERRALASAREKQAMPTITYKIRGNEQVTKRFGGVDSRTGSCRERRFG